MKCVLRIFFLICITVLLAGCKFAIIVIEGGEIQSEGSGVCLAGEICIIDVTDPDFSEEFTAVPHAGWAFEKWNSGFGFFCGGSTELFCHLSFGDYEESQEVANMVASDETFYLMPIFKRTSGYPPIIGGTKEWLQPADFLGYSPGQVEAICPPPSNVCSGFLPDSSFDLTGYRWASLAEIAELFNNISDFNPPITESDLRDPNAAPFRSVEVIFNFFRPTYTFFDRGVQRVLGAFTSDQASERGYYEGIIVEYGEIWDGDLHAGNPESEVPGVQAPWFWRPVD